MDKAKSTVRGGVPLDRALDDPFSDAHADTIEFELRGMFQDGFAAPVAIIELEPGDVVAEKYRILKRIARGGMGKIYRAEHVHTSGMVAVKVMHRSIAGGTRARKRFRLEARNAAALQHPNTIRVIDFGMDREIPYLVMEYVEGETVAELLRGGPIPWSRTVRILSQVLKSLWEAHEHERRIVHRDIKPSNILVMDQVGDRDFVKVLDFGISRALEGTSAGSIGLVGSPKTMAPEQWNGTTVSPQTDLYAVGCTAYEMLSGVPVYMAASPVVLGYKHIHEAAPELGARVPGGTPPGVVAWVKKMMQKDPARRPGSARAALGELEGAR